MRIRKWFCLACLVFAALLCGCQRSEVRKANQAMQLVRTMGAEVRAVSAEAAQRFTGRLDYEESRRAFGDERFDAGIPLGPIFQKSLEDMLLDVEKQLEKEPKDVDFLRKAVRRVRKFHQWWVFTRRFMKTRRDELAQIPDADGVIRPLDGRSRRAEVIQVMDETIRAIETFEAITLRCVRGIEDLLTQP
jgi:hypothetical protein